jgi:hypothetical protein
MMKTIITTEAFKKAVNSKQKFGVETRELEYAISHSNFDVVEYLKREITRQLAHKMVEEKAITFNRDTDREKIEFNYTGEPTRVYRAEAIIFSPSELREMLEDFGIDLIAEVLGVGMINNEEG